MIKFLIVFLLLAGNAYSQIFDDTCTAGSDVELSSHTPELGSYSALVNIDGDAGVNIMEVNSTLDECVPDSSIDNRSIAYPMNPAPTACKYTIKGVYQDNGAISSLDTLGFLFNYIDASNWYSCSIVNQDADTDVYIGERNGGGSPTALASDLNVGDLNGQTIECEIDYCGASPIITIDYGLGTLTHTDTTTKLTETKKTAVACGELRSSAGSCEINQGWDNIQVIARKAVIMMSKGEKNGRSNITQ